MIAKKDFVRKELNYNPLVSIIVITYNSAKYVLETLESAKIQPYKNIELIISDDGSKDDTVPICRKWLKKNQERFVKTRLITVEENTGIPANCNRGVKASQGEWVKLIAGDDALKKNCILTNMQFANSNKSVNVIHSNVEYYKDNFKNNSRTGVSDCGDAFVFSKKCSSQEQYHFLLNRTGGLLAPTLFLNRKTLYFVKCFDERLRLLEDVPLFLRLTKEGNKIHFLNETTIKYRVSASSIQKRNKPHMNIDFAKELLLFNSLYKKGKIKSHKLFFNNAGLIIIICLNVIGFNRNGNLFDLMFRVAKKIRSLKL
ncbi:glycosyl transferase [Desulfobacter hydrogenophilus]|uniref:Glycosyl transferase n=1 Tax=Desulfobacter hydrogenophilus TaxID=2291 RepID=A0A328FBI6_9BACT|nr:glycosyltransferase [Desulfobacter hydrogenophilus]NDY74098.1 glycosyltransferase [Desulfobacter hydrogenophilus]QBH14098.1 glycosyltransferase [Desulfobacter hydrogenophilus]RAM01659.1 glycosyl transferase [Desulfobacter hydrogenophilus]